MDLVIHGDASKVDNQAPGTGWSHVETDMYRNTKAVERIRSSLAKIKLPGAIHVMFDDNASTSFMLQQDADISGLTALMKPNMVNFFVRNNSGAAARHNPLTPWILLHRLHHSYELSAYRFLPIANRKVRTVNLISKMEDEIREVLGHPKMSQHQLAECDFVALACTMRSARANQLFSFNVDIASELFCQYHFTGDITFQGLLDWKFEEHTYLRDRYGHPERKFQFYAKMKGKFRHFYASKHFSVKFTDEQVAAVDTILSRFKPAIVEAIKYETEMMKTFPNVM